MNSLRAKLTFASLGLVLAFVWGLVVLTSSIVAPQMEAIEKDRQFEITRYLANELDQSMSARVRALTVLAGDIDPARMGDAAYVRKILEEHTRGGSQPEMSWMLIGADGAMLADYPVVAGRQGLSFADREYFKQALATGQVFIDKPLMGRVVKHPVIVISIPVRDARGKSRAVLTGIIDLSSHSLLGPMLGNKNLGRSEIFVMSLRDNLIIVAPDSRRVLTAAPAPGQSEINDRFRTGFEGSAVALNSSGIEKLFSGKRLATLDWIVIVAIPTEIAFKPIRTLRGTLYGAALAASLLALLFVGRLTQRLLAPLAQASARLDAMSSGEAPQERLPENGEEEVRRLLASFNRLSMQLQNQAFDLQHSESTYRSLFDNMLNGFAHCQMIFEHGVPVDFVYLNVNATFESLTGLQGVAGRKVSEVIPGIRESDPALFETYGRVATSGVPERHEVFVEALHQWFLLSVYCPQSGHFVVVFDVITERKQAEQELRLAATAFQAQVGIIVTDANGIILRANRTFTENTGYTSEDVIGQTPRLFKSGRHDAAFYVAMWDSIRSTGVWQGEIWDRRKNGEIYPKWMVITAVKDHDGVTTHYVSTQSDITARKAAEEEIKTLAFFDPLTHLPNRRLLLDRLHQTLANSARTHRRGALLFIDLDNFKTLNDTLGHDKGDLLLHAVALRLSACVREGDTVARLGGDEFVVLLEDLSKTLHEAAAQAELVCEKIMGALTRPYSLNGHEYDGTPSIGVALYSGQDETTESLLKQADLAMYQAKGAGRNTVRFFDPKMQLAVTARVALEKDLREAIRDGQLSLHYQAQVDEDGRVPGAEVLVRWRHPQRGMVFPNDFIPLAEETGLILPLGHWVLETACIQLGRWSARAETAHLSLAVNVSVKQLRQEDFVQQVLILLKRSGADPRNLKLEITESLLMDDVEDTIAKMSTLKAQGVGFALDDFGTGYSSLSYLKRLPLEKLKIDRSFVKDLLTDPNDAAIARTIVALAQSLGLSVIAEGVETLEQRDFLARNGCHAYQGYFFSRPLPLDEFEAYLKRARPGKLSCLSA